MKTYQTWTFLIMLIYYADVRAALSFPKTMELLSGKKIEPAKFQDTHLGIVFIFLSVKCPTSASHMRILMDLPRKFPQFKFLAVHSNFDESKVTAQNHFKVFSIEVISDENQLLADQLKAFKTPHVFIFNSKLETLYQGGITDSNKPEKAKVNYLESALEDITRGKKIRFPESRSLGCVILRKDKVSEI